MVLVRLVLSIVALGVCLWPFWMYLLVKSVLVPVGFWQNLVMLVGGVYLLAGFQIIFVAIFGMALWVIWIELR
ncbi:MAG: hypothetical protein Q8Q41_03520 [bacterium]|nr:hypothetical protein [bacterium]